ncbi:hypothetical protein HCN44_003527 [Aphidius gifuensis]|uniref:Uncharacterized protein n=1 Tax=Aphidius gifuensis TaxID=684658 RepID=A0A835CLT4_APHGI|nr:hypothetical protein HCN44_003527 [Aphidius gifuensis]
MEEQHSRDSSSMCKVCGDKASGKHYGVPSCDGCRGFFKRSIRRNLDYVCKENGQCIVDVSRRNQCQACRFAKCLEVNMKRDAVQHERAPRSTSSLVGAARRGPSTIYPSISHVYHTTGNPYPLMYPALFPFKPSLPAFNTGIGHFMPRPTPTESLAPSTPKDDEVTSSEEASVAIRQIEQKDAIGGRLPTTIMTPPLPDYGTTSQSILPTENIYESAARLLFAAVQWARGIPSFFELSTRDQSLLLEESWSELFVLTAAQWGFSINESIFSSMILPPDRKDILAEELRRLRDLLTRFAILRVNDLEYPYLKAIVLFKGECRGLCDTGRVSALQEQTVTLLSERGAARVGRLLLLLPPARALCRTTLQELLFKPTVGDVSIERLLNDMIRATRPI